MLIKGREFLLSECVLGVGEVCLRTQITNNKTPFKHRRSLGTMECWYQYQEVSAGKNATFLPFKVPTASHPLHTEKSQIHITFLSNFFCYLKTPKKNSRRSPIFHSHLFWSGLASNLRKVPDNFHFNGSLYPCSLTSLLQTIEYKTKVPERGEGGGGY